MLLVGIALLAVLLRLASAIYQGERVESLPGIHDQISYHALAQRVLDGHGFSFGENHWPATRANEPTAHWSYLYTLYLTASYALFGLHPLVARLIQAVVVGLLHTWLAWRIGTRIFGPSVGVVAALLSATYLYFVYYAGALITEPYYIVAILWTVDVALRLAAHQRATVNGAKAHGTAWWLWVELGLAAGIAILLRQLFLLFVPFLLLWLWWVAERATQAGRHGKANGLPLWSLLSPMRMRLFGGFALVVVVIGLLIAPWTIRNSRAFGQFVPLNTNAGYAFFWGNHPYYGTRFVGILPADGPSYFELIPRELLHLNEAELDRALLQRGLGFVADDPGRYLLLSLSRAVEYFKFWPSPDSGLLSNVVRVASFGVALPFVLYGLWLSVGAFRQQQNAPQQEALVLLYLFIAIYTLIHLLVWTLIRYRLPVDSILLFFAAVSLHRIFGRRLAARGFTPAFAWATTPTLVQKSQHTNESQTV
jgi:hypothetical protein